MAAGGGVVALGTLADSVRRAPSSESADFDFTYPNDNRGRFNAIDRSCSHSSFTIGRADSCDSATMDAWVRWSGTVGDCAY
jgi:hypothetical protein